MAIKTSAFIGDQYGDLILIRQKKKLNNLLLLRIYNTSLFYKITIILVRCDGR